MGEWITVDPDLIRSHAGRVEQVAGDVALAKDAAGSINLGGGAFGLMCSFLVLPTTVVSTMAQSALSAAGNMVQRSAREIRAVAKDFDTTESEVEKQISKLKSELGN